MKKTGIIVCVSAILAVVLMIPLLVTLIESVSSDSEIQLMTEKGKLTIIPYRVTGAHYYRLLFSSQWYLRTFWNSMFLTVVIVMGHVLISVMLGYVIAGTRFSGYGLLLFLLVAVAVMPYQVTLLPNYLVLRRLGLFDSWWALILPAWFAPTGPLLISWFVRGLPEGMLDAAMLETNSFFKVMCHFVIPNVFHGIIGLSLLSFASCWSMIEQPLVLIQNKTLYPLSMALESIRESSPGLFYAGAILYAAPVMLLYHYCKYSLVEGIEQRHDT